MMKGSSADSDMGGPSRADWLRTKSNKGGWICTDCVEAVETSDRLKSGRGTCRRCRVVSKRESWEIRRVGDWQCSVVAACETLTVAKVRALCAVKEPRAQASPDQTRRPAMAKA